MRRLSKRLFAPAYAPRPFLEFAMVLLPMLAGNRCLCFHFLASFLQRRKSDQCSKFVYSFSIRQLVKNVVAVLVEGELCAIALWPSFVHRNSIFEHGGLPRRNLVIHRSLFE